MEISERNCPLTFRSLHPNDGLKRGQRDTHVTWVNCDALFALPQDGMHPVESFQRSASTPRATFVALRECRIVEIIAAGSLHQIPAHRGHVPQLRTGAGHEG